MLHGAWISAAYPLELKELGAHLRKRRLDLGLHQGQAAQRVGAHPQTYRHWEKKQTKPALDCWPGIIQFLGYDPRPEPEGIGGRLAWRRAALGLSQQAVAHRLGVDAGTIKRWEQGWREPRGRWLLKVLRFLGQEPVEARSVAEQLRRCRDGLGLLQDAMAAKIGVHERTYQQWERGKREPRADVWPRVEAVLKDA
jgi:DNA-binding XRE family transcriptional regulator